MPATLGPNRDPPLPARTATDQGDAGERIPLPKQPQRFTRLLPNPRTRLPAGRARERERPSFASLVRSSRGSTHLLGSSPSLLGPTATYQAAHAQPCTKSWPVAPTLARPHRSLTSRASVLLMSETVQFPSACWTVVCVN